MKSPLVSIITPTFNSRRFVRETVASIKAQNYTNWELLITDDGSTDNTVEILNEIRAEDSRISVFCLKENKGASVARNHSLSRAKGKYVAFCDSDDLWMPDKLTRQIRFMKDRRLAFSYSSYDRIDEFGNQIGTVRCLPQVTYCKMLRNNYIGCLTAIYDATCVGNITMPDIKKRHDWAFWLKILRKCKEAGGLDESLAAYRVRSESISRDKIDLLQYNWKLYHELEQLGIIRSSYYTITFPIYYFWKKTRGR